MKLSLNTLKDCCLSVWIDNESSFGTFPLESMKCGVPVIGKVPDLMPEWMSEENGVWIADKNMIVDFISDFLQNWLEDNLNEDMFVKMEETEQIHRHPKVRSRSHKTFRRIPTQKRIIRKSTTKITK